MRSPDADTLVVGAGPHGLAACAYLLSERPADAGGLLVIDPQGWLDEWNSRLRRLGVRRLRSSCVHHPDPGPCALLGFARDRGREAEMTGSFSLPSVGLFADFCAAMVDRLGLEEVRVPLRVTGLRSDPHGAAVELEDGSSLHARRVVLATNPAVPRIPAWSRAPLGAAPAGRVRHSDDVDLDVTPLAG
ncbi:MAG TPA: FAD/NAD(P)-binding protein, partial [Candidatus Dormibacteraeota bacterium]